MRDLKMLKNPIKRFLILITFISCLAPSCNEQEQASPDFPDFDIKGIDGSMLAELLEQNIAFYNLDGDQEDILTILKNNGINTVRLRLWHSPKTDNSSLEQVSSIAMKLKERGFKIWLCIHYSDTWADPSKQTLPQAWTFLDDVQLTNEVSQYTYSVVKTIQPDYVQIGNEINNGFLHPKGTLDNYRLFLELIGTCLTSAKSGYADCKTIIHLAGHEESVAFINRYNLPKFDILGISYYPKWHGKSFTNLEASLRQLTSENDFEVVIAETAYPFTLDYADGENNIVGLEEQLIDGFPATKEGQHKFLETVNQLCAIIPRCEGYCYWGADWISFPSTLNANGSPWENQALFDFDNKALPAIEIFKN
jgi:arabinogalactan endo-1,4-beta-galactosidase